MLGGLPGAPSNPAAFVGAGAAPFLAAGAMEAGPTALAVAAHPAGAAVVGGALDYAHTGSVASAAKAAVFNALLARVAPGMASMVPRSLLARLTHGLAQEAVASLPAAVEAVAPAAAEAVPAAYQGIPPLMKIGSSAMEDAASALEATRASEMVRGAAGIASQVVPVAAASVPSVASAVVPATGLADTGGGAAGYVAGLVRDKAAAAVPAVADAADSLMQNRLRASVLLKQNPAALAEEVAAKVVQLKQGIGKGLSAAQVGASLEDLYGFSKSTAKNMVDMIFQTHGLK